MIDFDREGPGFVGHSLDLQANLGGMVRLYVEQYDRETNQWRENKSIASGKAITKLRGPYQTTEEVFVAILRGVAQIGEMAFLPIDWEGEVRYLAVMPHTIEASKAQDPATGLPLSYIVRLDPDAKPGDQGRYFELPRRRYFRIWEPDHEYQFLPHSDWRRTVDDIRRYRTLQRVIHRAASSQLGNAGLVRFEGNANEAGTISQSRRGNSDANNNRVRLGYLGSIIESILEAGKLHLDDVHEEMVSGAMPHMIVTPNPVQRIDLGMDIKPSTILAKKDALEDVARSSPLPRSVVVEGLGSSERNLNNYLQDETLKQTAVIPTVMRACQGLTLAFLHPLMKAKLSPFTPETFAPGQGLTIKDFRIGFDDSPLNIEPDEADVVETGVKIGALKPAAYAKAIGWEEYELKQDTPEWNHWLLTNGRNANGQPMSTDSDASDPAPVVASAAPWFADLQ